MPAPQYAQMSPRRDEADDADDAVLLQRVAGGDRDALGALYRRHAHVVLAQIRLAVGEPGLSEEILQDTMLAVWQGAGSFRGVLPGPVLDHRDRAAAGPGSAAAAPAGRGRR